MSQSSIRQLHMGCGESLMATWSALKKAAPKTSQKKEASKNGRWSAQMKKAKGAC